MMISVLLIILALSICYYLLKSNYEYWEKKGVPGPKPRWIVGNMGESFLLKKTPGQIYVDIYKAYPDVPFVGAFRASTPVMVLRDPEVIKEVLIKSFSSFHDNDLHVDQEADPLFAKNPMALRGEEWKIVRSQVSPGFTSGKMKWIFPHLEDNSLKLVEFIAKQEDAFSGKGYDAKELCTRFTLDNVASCAFGLEGKCFEEENSEFRQIARDFFSPSSWAFFAFFLITLIPSLSKIISIRLTPKKVEKKLTEVVAQTLKYREENNIVRNDFLHVLNGLKKTCKDYEFTDLDVTVHASGFFADGYETSSLAMSYILFEIACNAEIQDRLRQEINQKFEENQNKLPYDALQKMPYLDSVCYESMRIHSPVYTLFKLCTKTYTFTATNEITKPVVIEKGTPVVIPVEGIQNDPKYFDDPKVFKPERFLGDNKDKIKKCTFMPFGEGPRTCLGQRFGILQLKIGIAYVVKNYILSVNKKMKVPLEYEAFGVQRLPVGGFWIDFKKIS